MRFSLKTTATFGQTHIWYVQVCITCFTFGHSVAYKLRLITNALFFFNSDSML